MTCLFAGNEDFSFQGVSPGNPTILEVVTNSRWATDTTVGTFRAGFARNSFVWRSPSFLANGTFMRSGYAFTSSRFWTTYRSYVITNSPNNSTEAFFRLTDAAGVVRLQARMNNSFITGTIVLEKLNAAGTPTILATSTLGIGANAVMGKIDVYVDYSATGSFALYYDRIPLAVYSGDVTTDGQTSLAYVDFGPIQPRQSFSASSYISEVYVDTEDTRPFIGLVSQIATANGNTHNWTGGAAGDSDDVFASISRTTPQYSDTPGQIQEYQVTPALPAGAHKVQAVIHVAEAAKAVIGPTKFQFMVRTGGADFVSPNQSPTNIWDTVFRYEWTLNPNTGLAWSKTEIVNSSTLFNMGVKSIA